MWQEFFRLGLAFGLQAVVVLFWYYIESRTGTI